MSNEQNFYQFTAKSITGNEITMDQYKGKVVLLVNTASLCGFTPQYKGLEALYQKYKERGLVILGFPCNQFRNQEPGTAKEIADGCLLNYGVTFPMFDKVEVNGEHSHAIFSYLKGALPGWFGEKIKWNFTKFLVDTEGKPIKRFAPMTKPEKIEAYILPLLK